ncbi:T9SS type A sorting domain-containing protein [Rufibacter radiotolerans]|uniref:T9SS type A sorting domain-containing protein n=1 Tax=Rufibacter radiotolerans TaxID=1379910 RepID=UPI001E4C0070|nr:T9SS type A sorting domain-containing protein [Rufibacter radiotolerans]
MAGYKVAVYYVVPKDASYSQAEYDAIRKASREIQAWYQINSGGMTYTFSEPDTVLFYQGLQNTSYYQGLEDNTDANESWWVKLLSEMDANGVPIWEPGIITTLWIKTGQTYGIGLGAQGCEGACGVAMAGVENFPEFNNTGICPTNPEDNYGFMYPCVPHGTMAHEMGHAFGLPHPETEPFTQEVAYHSLMQTHWNYPNLGPPTVKPWGLLTVERTHLWENPFFQEGISLRQIYDADVVNLPPTGEPPDIKVNYAVAGQTLHLNNHTKGAGLYYWTFGDGSVSNEVSPRHSYAMPGRYTVALRASAANGMTSLYEFAVEVKDIGRPSWSLLKIFPNPSHDGHFTISFPPNSEPFQLTVTNRLGTVLFTKTVTDASVNQELDLSAYGKGVYFLRIETQDRTKTRVLVVL